MLFFEVDLIQPDLRQSLFAGCTCADFPDSGTRHIKRFTHIRIIIPDPDMFLAGYLYKINAIFQIVQHQRLCNRMFIAPFTKDAILIQAVSVRTVSGAVWQIGNIDPEITVAGTDP